MGKKKIIKRVVIALDLSFASQRDIFHGISIYAKAHHWQLEFTSVPDMHAYKGLRMKRHADVDGIISCETSNEIIRTIHPGKKVPMALVTVRPQIEHMSSEMNPVVWVHVEGNDIGACGADHFMSCGRFRSFGFVPETQSDSINSPILLGFENCLKVKSLPVNVHTADPGYVAGSEQDIDALAQWLADLPKPAAVMAIYDLRATQVLAAALKASIAVPKQLSVIGVDNDGLLCDFTTPTLTSIALDNVRIGTHAAQALDSMMRTGNHIESSVRTVDARPHIIERESTAHLAPAVSLVERAMSYIRKNALSEINVTDVVEHLGVSRRLADRRFREIEKSSIMETIISIRLNEVKSRLASTCLPIGLITQACGFRNDNYAKNLFRRRFGMSMREWRKHAIKGHK